MLSGLASNSSVTLSLSALGRAMSRAAGPSEIYDAALDALATAIDVRRSAILLFDAGGVMRFVGWRGLSSEYRATVEGHSPWTRDSLDPEPVLVGDPRADEAMSGFMPAFEGEGIGALAFVPLLGGAGLIGKFMLYYDDTHDFTQDEVLAAQLIASQVGFALDQLRMRQELEASRTELTDFIESSPLAMHWVARDGSILWANQAELDMLGYGAEEYIGRNVRAFYASQEVITDIIDRLARHEVLRDYPAQLRAADGSLRDVLIDSSVFWEDGEFGHTRCLMRDVTEQLKAEQLHREADQLKNEFLGLVSHELRTPISTILGNGAILKHRGERLTDVQKEQCLEDIVSEAERLQRVIENLLLITRMDAGREGTTEVVDLATLLRRSTASFEQRYSDRPILLELPDGALNVEASEGLVLQIVENLLSNAHKYSEDRRPIEVTLERTPGFAELTVADRGIGLEPSALGSLLFTPFYRSRAAKAVASGTGLGLAAVKRMVEALGGSVTASNRGDGEGGAVFRCVLPLVERGA